MTTNLTRGALQFRTLLGLNCAINGTNFHTNPTVDAGLKVNPIPICSLGIFARTGMNTGNRTGFHTIRYAFTHIRHNCMGHNLFSPNHAKLVFYPNASLERIQGVFTVRVTPLAIPKFKQKNVGGAIAGLRPTRCNLVISNPVSYTHLRAHETRR